MDKSHGARIWNAARDLVGCRFRLHGRDPDYGLDCVGLALVAARRAGARIDAPDRYALVGGDAAYWCELMDRFGLTQTTDSTGDILLLDCGRRQFHLAIAGPCGTIHAHRGLGRVVETPGAPEGRIMARRCVPDHLFAE